MLAVVLGSSLLPHTILDSTVPAKTPGWPESFETNNRSLHPRTSTPLLILPYHQEFLCTFCLPMPYNHYLALQIYWIRPAKKDLQVGSGFSWSPERNKNRIQASKLMNALCTSWNPWITYSSNIFLTLTIHPMGSIPVKIGKFTIYTASINTGTFQRSGRSDQSLGTKWIEFQKKNNNFIKNRK